MNQRKLSRNAFTRRFKELYPRLFAKARRWLGHGDDAEDAVQDTWGPALDHWDGRPFMSFHIQERIAGQDCLAQIRPRPLLGSRSGGVDLPLRSQETVRGLHLL